jgi:hypothetical protein
MITQRGKEFSYRAKICGDDVECIPLAGAKTISDEVPHVKNYHRPVQHHLRNDLTMDIVISACVTINDDCRRYPDYDLMCVCEKSIGDSYLKAGVSCADRWYAADAVGSGRQPGRKRSKLDENLRPIGVNKRYSVTEGDSDVRRDFRNGCNPWRRVGRPISFFWSTGRD